MEETVTVRIGKRDIAKSISLCKGHAAEKHAVNSGDN